MGTIAKQKPAAEEGIIGSKSLPSQLHIHAERVMSTKKQRVVELLKAIETGAAEPVAVINPNQLKQHNLGAEDGLAGFEKVLSRLAKGSAKVNTVRVFEDGDYVFAHTDYNFFGPKIAFDIFRFENGYIVEHWDNPTGVGWPEPKRQHND